MAPTSWNDTLLLPVKQTLGPKFDEVIQHIHEVLGKVVWEFSSVIDAIISHIRSDYSIPHHHAWLTRRQKAIPHQYHEKLACF